MSDEKQEVTDEPEGIEIKPSQEDKSSMSGEKQETAGEPEGQESSKSSSVKNKARVLAGATGQKIRSLASSPEFRSVRPLTWLGMVLGAAFFVGLFIDAINIRWWIMLPLGIASFLIFWKQWKSTPEDRTFELKLTFFGMVAMLGFLIVRDAWLSGSLADIYEKAKASGETIKEFQKLIGR